MTATHTQNETEACKGFDVGLDSESDENRFANQSECGLSVEDDKRGQLIASGDLDGLFILAYKRQLLALAENFAR